MLAPRLPDRLTALRAWSARHVVRARTGAEWTWGKVSSWPWPRIGVWAGGVFGLLVLGVVLVLTFADWNALKGPVSRMASAASGREVVIQGDLEVHAWSWTPEIRVTQLQIGNPARYHARGDFATFNEVKVAVRLLPLFIGRFDVVRLDLNGAALALYRNAAGDGNWMPDPRADRGRAINLPAIRQFSLRGGRLQFVDELRNMTLDAAFTSNETGDAADPGHFRLHGEGRINSQTFTMTLTGAPLLNVQRDRPYAFNADITAGATHLVADGAIRRPFDLSAWNANVRGSGPDLADLYPLTGLALPNTPPYTLAGRLDRVGVRYAMTGLHGRVGDSDLRGGFTATRKVDGRLLLDGDFTTASLDFDDLMAVLGGAPSTAPGETASDGQRALAANLRAQDRFLPDARLDISRVRNMDARVSYRAAQVRSDRAPLRGLAIDLTLDHGLLRADPLTLDLSQGRLAGAVVLNARQDTPHVDLDMRLTNARLESVFAVQGRPAIEGRLTGRARLSGNGASVRQVAANADGDVTLVTPHGEVRESLAELTGINVTRGLGLLLSHDQGAIGIRCGVAHFRVENGIAHARSIVLDTDTMLITGEGSVSLRDESLDLRIHGEPKEMRLVSVAAPITVQGRLRNPKIGVDVGRGITQGGAAALLASLVAPLAAILPFVDAGLAEDADCSALLAGRSQPARAG